MITLLINIESVLYVGYMNGFWRDRLNSQQYMQLFTLCFLYLQI